MRRRAAAVAAGVLLALGLVWRLAGPAGTKPALPTASARAPSAPDVLAPDLPARAPSAPPSAAVARLAPGVEGRGTLSARAERMRADWCGFGATEHERDTDAILQRIQAANGMVGQAALAEMNATDGARVLTEARDQVRQRWVQALRQQGDPRSLALAEYLGPGEDALAEETAASRRRLQAMALSASDPMLTALALMRPCTGRVCVNVEASQWSRLEPQNLQAWLALLRGAPERALPLDYVIERMASQGQYTNAYDGEVIRRLLTLPQATAPGLQAEAEMQFVMGVAASWTVSNIAPISRACQAPSPPAGRPERCEAIAQVLWRGDDLLSRGMALRLARALLAARPAARAAWEPRALEFEAVQAWMQLETDRWTALVDTRPVASPCTLQPLAWRPMQERWTEGEWAHAMRGMQAAGVDPAALAVQWRLQAGRGALDAMPPASAATR